MPLAPSAHVARELRSLRVIGGDAETGYRNGREQERIGRCDGRERHAETRDYDPGREKPERAASVRPVAERRLHD
jgi:hypothetical protein